LARAGQGRRGRHSARLDLRFAPNIAGIPAMGHEKRIA
jgi:hypothetical protein